MFEAAATVAANRSPWDLTGPCLELVHPSFSPSDPLDIAVECPLFSTAIFANLTIASRQSKKDRLSFDLKVSMKA
jgi:hypothetical protein